MKAPLALLLAALTLAASLKAEGVRATLEMAPRNLVRELGEKPATGSGEFAAPVARLTGLTHGLTVRDTAGSRTILTVGREILGSNVTAPKSWTVKFATTW